MKKYLLSILLGVSFSFSLIALIFIFNKDKTVIEITKEEIGRNSIYLECSISKDEYETLNISIKSDDYEHSNLVNVVDKAFVIEFNDLTFNQEYVISIYKEVENKNIITDFVLTPNLGCEDNPFLIYTISDFLSLDTYNTDYCILQQDLDFQDEEYISFISSFNGIFNGNNYTLKNISTKTYNHQGIFLMLQEDGVIKDLNIENISYESLRHSNLYMGGLVSQNYGTIENVNISNSKLTSNGPSTGIQYIGGVVGVNYATGVISNSTISNSTINPSIPHTAYIGGFCSVNEGVITNCSVEDTNIVATYNLNAKMFGEPYSSNIYFGSFCGHNLNSITNCTTNSNIAFFVDGTKTGEKYNVEVTNEETRPETLENLVVAISDFCSLDEGMITNCTTTTTTIDIENAFIDELSIDITSNSFVELNLTVVEETVYYINKEIEYSLTYREESYDDLNSEYEYSFNKIK